MKLYLAQLNPIVGDMAGNLAKAKQVLDGLAGREAGLVVFPELFLTGYPPQDLVERRWFVDREQQALEDLVRYSQGVSSLGLLVGCTRPSRKNTGRGLYNAAVLVQDGRILFEQYKTLLPTYDVFDEARYFDSADRNEPVPFLGERLGISICEDVWNEPEVFAPGSLYTIDPIQVLSQAGATVFVNISSSPFQVDKEEIRYSLLRHHVLRHGRAFALVNQVGGNDELIFDGRSFCLDRKANLLARFPAFREHVEAVDTDGLGTSEPYCCQNRVESVYEALVLGTRDYVQKSGFVSAAVGLSGGIDSAVVLCLAQAALGPENVLAVSMPSPFSSVGSVEDARVLAQNLGVRLKTIPITSIFEAYLASLTPEFEGRPMDVTEENIQARIRGNILMALSNKFGHLVLATGNKSELAMGYCTLYGDMAGGLGVIADVPKQMVYHLARYINRRQEIIPGAILDKAPSAELRPNQKDQDSLPPYDLLDQVLAAYIEQGRSVDEIVAQGFDRETVRWILRVINRNEYKRKQAAPALKVTSKAFGVGRKMPIVARLVL